MFSAKQVFAMLSVTVVVAVVALAGDGFQFKCQEKECGFNPMVIFGGGMMSEKAMGWCHTCKAIKAVHWTRAGAPALDPNAKPVPQPKPLAEVWVGTLGQTRKIYKCPTCEGGFMEIRRPEELTHCPKCSKPGFKIDPDAPRLIVD